MQKSDVQDKNIITYYTAEKSVIINLLFNVHKVWQDIFAKEYSTEEKDSDNAYVTLNLKVKAENGDEKIHEVRIFVPYIKTWTTTETYSASKSWTYNYNDQFKCAMGYALGSNRCPSDDKTYDINWYTENMGNKTPKIYGTDVVGTIDKKAAEVEWLETSFQLGGWLYQIKIEDKVYSMLYNSEDDSFNVKDSTGKIIGMKYSPVDGITVTLLPTSQYTKDGTPYITLTTQVENTINKNVMVGAFIDTYIDTI